jgi:very-short-patch-repair endonuclease
MAAVVAYGDRAVLSHRSAAVLWGLQPERGPRIDVTVPAGGGRRNRRTVIVHASRLREQETTKKAGIRVTTPARTIIDLADISTARELERAIDEADYLRLELAELSPIPGRRGAGRLARVLAEHEAGSTLTLSEFEERLVALCSRSGLPMPRINHHVEGYLADFVWPAARLIVETDGWRAHGTRGAFERDRLRDAALTEAGWRVVRITWKRLENEPGSVAAQLGRLLAPSV